MLKKRFDRILAPLAVASAITVFGAQAYASGFQLFEQNGAGVGDYHAGGAAEAEDASTGFYNPAGLTRIQNQQLVLGAVAIRTSMKFKGDIGPTSKLAYDEGQGGVLRFVPNMHYAYPID